MLSELECLWFGSDILPFWYLNLERSSSPPSTHLFSPKLQQLAERAMAFRKRQKLVAEAQESQQQLAEELQVVWFLFTPALLPAPTTNSAKLSSFVSLSFFVSFFIFLLTG